MPVSLQNLLKIGQLKAHPPEATEVQRLLASAARNLADARVDATIAANLKELAYGG